MAPPRPPVIPEACFQHDPEAERRCRGETIRDLPRGGPGSAGIALCAMPARRDDGWDGARSPNSDAMAGRMPAMQQAAPRSLIPRAKLFGNPTRAQAQLSPDGHWLSWLAPKDGVLNIWVAPVGDMNAARVISDDSKRGIRFHGWMPNGTHVLYVQDEGGTEDFHVFAVEVATREVRNLTPHARACTRRCTASASIFPTPSPSASTSATSPGTTCSASTSAPASASCCSRTRERAVAHRARPPAQAAAGHPRRGPRRAAARAIRIEDGKLDRDRRGRARGRPDHLHHRLHARRQHALQRLLDRPRQGRAVRHRCGHRARSACWPSTRRPTSAACWPIPRRT